MTTAQRSAAMAGIKGANTQPELWARKALWRAGFRYRLHQKSLPGRPDIVLTKWRAVIFVHGCFWHYHAGCRLFKLPGTRTEFWSQKLATNAQRDQRQIIALIESGWRVLIVWECAIRFNGSRSETEIISWIRDGKLNMEFGAKSKIFEAFPIQAEEGVP